jgi:hypothetical protein
MIFKSQVVIDNKLQICNFIIDITDKLIKVNCDQLNNNFIKIPVINKYNGIDYYPIYFPVIMPKYENMIFNPYLILVINNNINNELDFFNKIIYLVKQQYQYNFYDIDSLINNLDLTMKIIKDNYLNYLLMNYNDNIASEIWFSINLIKLFSIILNFQQNNINVKEIIKKYQISKKIINLLVSLKNIKYNILGLDDEYKNNMDGYNNFNNKINNISQLEINNYYYINNYVNGEQSSEIQLSEKINKIIKVYVNKILKNNIVLINNNKNLLFDGYNWYYYHPTINIDKQYIIYNTFINYTITNEALRLYLNIQQIHSTKILEYYLTDTKMSNLIYLKNIFNNLNDKFNDLEILKSNNFSPGFFEYITKKYSELENKYEILGILFNNYNYPLKSNRHELESTFDYIIFFSLYNYKSIFVSNNKNYDFIHPNLNNMIPLKFRNLYIGLLKGLCQMINKEYEAITFNQKFYSDYLLKNIIKIFFIESNSLSVNLFTGSLTQNEINKFKNIVYYNFLLSDLTNKLTWNNLPKKLNYLNLFYKHPEIVYFQDKLNKNIFSDNYDYRIKKIIEYPLEMFKYLRKEKDFIKWTRFISDKILELFYVPISLSSDDFNILGKLIFLLFNVKEQNIKEQSYINFISFCSQNKKLVLDSNRVNLKIRESFPNLKSSINLGYLAKHLTWDKDNFTFDEKQDKTPEIIDLENKLNKITKKYYKYKAKYLEAKNIKPESIIKYKNNYSLTKSIISDTSSIMH